MFDSSFRRDRGITNGGSVIAFDLPLVCLKGGWCAVMHYVVLVTSVSNFAMFPLPFEGTAEAVESVIRFVGVSEFCWVG